MKISVVTSCFNSSETIRATLDSIRAQDYDYLELIIVDGGSTDGTLEVLNNYPHLIILHQTEKLGMYHAIDLGFKIWNFTF